MAVEIHPSALVEPGADLADGVRIGAFCFIGPHVRLGAGTVVHHHASIEGRTSMGEHCEVFPYAFLGGRTQDKKWKGEETRIRIGDRCTFREFSTIHPATFDEGATEVGSDNLFLAYSHIGHDCRVGSFCVFSNNATLAGHVTVADRVVLGGHSAVHQFARIGRGAMIGGMAGVRQDILPCMIADGYPAEHRYINKVGLQRSGFDEERIQTAARIFKLVFRRNLTRSEAAARLRAGELGEDPLCAEIAAFIETSERGVA